MKARGGSIIRLIPYRRVRDCIGTVHDERSGSPVRIQVVLSRISPVEGHPATALPDARPLGVRHIGRALTGHQGVRFEADGEFAGYLAWIDDLLPSGLAQDLLFDGGTNLVDAFSPRAMGPMLRATGRLGATRKLSLLPTMSFLALFKPSWSLHLSMRNWLYVSW